MSQLELSLAEVIVEPLHGGVCGGLGLLFAQERALHPIGVVATLGSA